MGVFSYNNTKREKFVLKKDQTIFVRRLDNQRAATEFLKTVKEILSLGVKGISVDFSQVTTIFPNAITPIVGIISYYRSEGIVFTRVGRSPSKYVDRILTAPEFRQDHLRVLGSVWHFRDSEDVSLLVTAYKEELLKCDRFPKGVITALEWSLYEVMDNVIQHSLVGDGYVMGQLQTNKKNIAFTVYDYGQGIYNSLKDTHHSPRTPVDAITLAMREEVTRNKSIGQGNGLFGLYSIIKQGKGRLAITSGGGRYLFDHGSTETNSKLPFISKDKPGTIVDFQFGYSEDFSIDKALKFRGKNYPIVNLWLENMEDEIGQIIYNINEHSEGTGTRQSAIKVKNEIFNILTEKPRRIIIDFKGVDVISSSFADELIAKLLLELGLFQFNNLISLKGLDNSQQKILQHSVIQRLIEEFVENVDK